MQTPDTHRRATALFTEARRLPGSEIAGWLEAKSNREPAIIEYVWSLLRHDVGDAPFLETPVTPLVGTVLLDAPAAPIPAAIGPYRVVSCLGEGGHGVVYLGEQERPARTVAIKVLRWHGGSPIAPHAAAEVLRRFDRERDILAAMDHPGIAQIFGAGVTERGEPYFVLEYIRGERITAAADRRTLTIPQRLAAFLLACEAVTHAHERGVIHRDLTPSNIMLMEEGIMGEGIKGSRDQGIEKSSVSLLDPSMPRSLDPFPIKIIDFGIAKVTDAVVPGLMSSFALGPTTDTLARPMGTPVYMSPEQARGERGVSVRTDVYSLGVVLFELLTGTVPFTHADPVEVINMVRNPELAAPGMLVALSKASGTTGEEADRHRDERAATRGTDAASLARTLRGELSWIVQRALEKDPARRYDTVAELADDVRAYLRRDRPVRAAPPSGWYRARKFARRNRRVLITAAAVGLPLAATAGWMFIEARRYWRESSALINHAMVAFDAAGRSAFSKGTPEGFKDAAYLFEQSVRAAEIVGEGEGASAADTLGNWATSLERLKRHDDQAIDVYRRAWQGRSRHENELDRHALWYLWDLADAQAKRGFIQESEVSYRELVRLLGLLPSPSDYESQILKSFAEVLDAAAKPDEAAAVRARLIGTE